VIPSDWKKESPDAKVPVQKKHMGGGKRWLEWCTTGLWGRSNNFQNHQKQTDKPRGISGMDWETSANWRQQQSSPSGKKGLLKVKEKKKAKKTFCSGGECKKGEVSFKDSIGRTKGKNSKREKPEGL